MQNSGDVSGTLGLLRDGNPHTRAELAQITGQARSTVAARVEQLLESGLVSPMGDAVSTGGRPPATFAFNPSARIVAAVDLGATHARIATTTLASTVIAEHLETIVIGDGPELVLARAGAMAAELIKRSGRTMSELVG